MLDIFKLIAEELSITKKQVQNTVNLIDEGGTVPFIARYRKEVTENLDEDTTVTIEADYQVDQDTTWIPLPDTFDNRRRRKERERQSPLQQQTGP